MCTNRWTATAVFATALLSASVSEAAPVTWQYAGVVNGPAPGVPADSIARLTLSFDSAAPNILCDVDVCPPNDPDVMGVYQVNALYTVGSLSAASILLGVNADVWVVANPAPGQAILRGFPDFAPFAELLVTLGATAGSGALPTTPFGGGTALLSWEELGVRYAVSANLSNVDAVPEPASAALLAASLVGLGTWRTRRAITDWLHARG